ncbi:ankyrin [Lepidopterella palustris CBS 459.81]|uniref:Ankyrin n=1 Tax=Lepidopterella palustris CBS 459.81 TaxID=1314670 RepID=A0A8E2JEM4_9PEZI|nr:ankyrin [Lepidopterella palustris CBS 459.81]
MSTGLSVQEIARREGLKLVAREICLSAPSPPPPCATHADCAQARHLLVEQRKGKPGYRDPDKQLKRIFRSSKEKEKLQDPTKWEFSQEELDEALLTAINQHANSAGLVQAFLDLGANVNIIDTSNEKVKKRNGSLTRRSTVLQHAASLRKLESVSLLASSGADPTTLDEGLKAALAANDLACIEELLRHGAHINNYPGSFAQAVSSQNEDLVRLMLRAPKMLKPEYISPCLELAVNEQSVSMASLLVAYGADPNFHNASAFKQALRKRTYLMAVAIAAGSTRLEIQSLRGTLDIVLNTPDQLDLQRFVELLMSCGLPSNTDGLPQLLICAVKSNQADFVRLLVDFGVSPNYNQAESLKHAVSNSNWQLVDILLAAPITNTYVSSAIGLIPIATSRHDRFRVIEKLIGKAAKGSPLGEWLIIAVEEDDIPLMSLLVSHGAPFDNRDNRALLSVVSTKDLHKLRVLLEGRPSTNLLEQLFPLLREGYARSERLEATRLLLGAGARGKAVDTALIDAAADSSRDIVLIEELLRSNADVNFDNGKSVQLAVKRADFQVVRLLCNAGPSVETASAVLPLTFGPKGRRSPATFAMIELLIGKGVSNTALQQTLILAISGGSENLDIINLLVEYDKSLGKCALQSVLSLESSEEEHRILASLLRMGIPNVDVDNALVYEAKVAVDKNSLSLVELLVDNGASVNFNDGEAIRTSVISGSIDLTKILLTGNPKASTPTLTKAFRALIHDSHSEKNDTAIQIATLLLQSGVDQPAIDAALRTVLDHPDWDANSGAMVDILLQYGSNVNTGDGTCFAFAARKGDTALFNKLLDHKPDYEVILSCLLISKLNETAVVQYISLCFNHGCSAEVLGSCRRSKEPFLFLAMQEYPRGKTLINLLLSNGCDPNMGRNHIIDESVGQERVSILVWALDQPQKAISTGVILALLQAGALPNTRTPTSELTPLAIAAREGRTEVVKTLIARGAEISIRDKSNRSPLFYASSKPFVEIVTTICQNKALQNDGSLHEAARNLQFDVASILVKFGHNPNFPSRLHGGRNALGELVLNAEIGTSKQRTRLRELIRLLLDANANPKFRARNEKSVVILALENAYHAVEVTEALLETEVWEDLNDEKHMFRSDAGFWYSPLSYVELMPRPGREQQKTQLTELLKDKGCAPKFYAEKGEQPDGAVGLPPSLARIAERYAEHKEALRLEREKAENARLVTENTHRDSLRQRQERELAEQNAIKETFAVQQQLEQSKHDFEVHRLRELERVKREEKSRSHRMQIEQERDTAVQQLQIEERRASANLKNEGRLIQQRQAEMDYRIRSEQKALLDKEKADERNLQRQNASIDRMDQSARLHARLRQGPPSEVPLRIEEYGQVD